MGEMVVAEGGDLRPEGLALELVDGRVVGRDRVVLEIEKFWTSFVMSLSCPTVVAIVVLLRSVISGSPGDERWCVDASRRGSAL
ncbi:hypothetical protein [Methylopila turkensis]|uniref:hypothetical protein n=1 Tax=Methylopila turkensis TaxID=1437816 RepID=UPI002852D478|nr:hypothetical protein [Methylopila turkensis]